MDAADWTSEEFAALSSEMEMELAPESDMEVVPDSITPDSKMELAPESEMEVVPDSITPDSKMELAPESEVLPDSLPLGAFICGRCHLVHEDREAWNHAHSIFYPCPRCHLKHADYTFFALRHGIYDFDCKLFIPDPDNVVIDGDTIVLPPHVLKMIEEKSESDAKKRAAKKNRAKASQE